MFGIGFSELVIIAVVALVVVGPQKMPDLMRQLGRFFVQLRRISNEVRSSIDDVMQEAEEDLLKEQQKKAEQEAALAQAKSAESTLGESAAANATVEATPSAVEALAPAVIQASQSKPTFEHPIS